MTGWDTRADSGLRPPRAISTNINPTHGVAGHYGGSGPFKRADHDGCRAIWRAWQDFHMSPDNSNNYVDIAYNLGVCHHDIILEGRSTRSRPIVRGGANGNFTVNTNRYSVVVIWGVNDGEWPDTLKRAWRTARDWLRDKDTRTGTGLTPHSAMSSTSCPGDPGRAFLVAGAPYPSSTGDDDMPTAKEVADEVIRQLTYDVSEDDTIAKIGLFAAGRTLQPESGLAYGWGYAKDNRRTLRQVLAELAEAKAERAAQRELLVQLAGQQSGVELTDEQVAAIAQRIAEAGEGACRQVLDRLSAAGDALADDA